MSNALIQFKLDFIKLNLFIPGRQGENGTAHSTIEKQHRNRTIYAPMEWETTIKQAFKKST